MASATAAAVTNAVAAVIAAADEKSTRAAAGALEAPVPSTGAEPGDGVEAATGSASGKGAGVPLVHPHVNDTSTSVTSSKDSVPSKSPGPKQREDTGRMVGDGKGDRIQRFGVVPQKHVRPCLSVCDGNNDCRLT